ncbi:MAG: N-acetyl-gamma-glutamyl-phosphate reductase, partial [Alphaproteobacteria bacterium]|nr:N-acetyl-gamma-glutamyl-phosphate reductase [Alphaproteobacteria bacterium]
GHRHIPEIEQQISKITQKESKINFVPHLVPMNRGELITSHLRTTEEIRQEQIIEIYRQTFRGEKFISILDNGVLPNTINVRGSNNCHISIVPGRIEGTLMVISAIDNLVKGSSGQAIQNMNLILGYPEELGISHISLFP